MKDTESRIKKILNKFFKLDHQDLTHQWPFRFAIGIPLALFVGTGITVWCPDYTIGFSKESYSTFLKISQFPLYLLSISIPAVAIVAHIHRTIQTAKQIQLTIDKNKPDSFYTQLKGVTDQLKTLPSMKFTRSNDDGTFKSYTFEIKHTYRLFYHIYKNSSAEKGASSDISLEFISSITSEFKKIEEHIDSAKKNKKSRSRSAKLYKDIRTTGNDFYKPQRNN